MVTTTTIRGFITSPRISFSAVTSPATSSRLGTIREADRVHTGTTGDNDDNINNSIGTGNSHQYQQQSTEPPTSSAGDVDQRQPHLFPQIVINTPPNMATLHAPRTFSPAVTTHPPLNTSVTDTCNSNISSQPINNNNNSITTTNNNLVNNTVNLSITSNSFTTDGSRADTPNSASNGGNGNNNNNNFSIFNSSRHTAAAESDSGVNYRGCNNNNNNNNNNSYISRGNTNDVTVANSSSSNNNNNDNDKLNNVVRHNKWTQVTGGRGGRNGGRNTFNNNSRVTTNSPVLHTSNIFNSLNHDDSEDVSQGLDPCPGGRLGVPRDTSGHILQRDTNVSLRDHITSKTLLCQTPSVKPQ
ncbi:putative uncharacterized protein DDB_G0277255 [Microplitis demolitor]|uniref:putative uncharacterized protein DDB_G0277255 n=1 Tax=Microplitis demolitor TaxID=69319 RepID=UPI0004CD1795|nr:putative uncharacterized protein DDB_G0277255 [Microplitis demolitor]